MRLLILGGLFGMGKFTKVSKIAMAAAVGSAAVVVPVATQAAETELTPAKVAFNVDGEVKIITADEYIAAVMGLEPTILAAITNAAGEVVAPETVNIGGKYISSEAYVLAYMSGDVVTQEEIDAAESVSVDGAKELVDGEWVDVETDPIEGEITVESVSAINLTTVNVEFSEAVEALDRTDVVVTNQKSSAKQTVKEVKLAEDGLSAEVTFYNNLVASTTYGVEVTVGETKASGEVVIGDLKPASVTAETTQTVKANVSTDVKFKVLDADGVDITGNLPTGYSVAYTSAAVSGGKVTLGPGVQTTTKVQIKDANGAVVTSSEDITLTSEAIVFTQVSNWTLGNNNFDNEKYEQVTKVAIGSNPTFKIEVKDQFGTVATGYTVAYKSLDTTAAIVDASTGKVTVITKDKVVPVQIDVKDAGGKVVLTEVVEIQTVAAAAYDSFALDTTEVALSKADTTVGKKVTVNLKDQFNNAWKQDVAVKIKAKSTAITVDSTADATEVTKQSTTTGKVEFTLKATAGAEAGNYEVDVYTGTGATLKKQTITVTLEETGAFAKYEVKGIVETLDKKAAATNGSTTISVVPVDANGNVLSSTATKFEYELKGKNTTANNVEKTTADNTSLTLSASGLAVDTYTLTVYDAEGTIVYGTYTFEVVDTTPASKVDFTTTDLTTVEISDKADLIAALEDVLLINGTVATSGQLADVTFTTGSESVIANNGTVFADATANIYVTSITLTENNEVVELGNTVEFAIKTKFDATKHLEAPADGATSVESSDVSNLLDGVNAQNAKFLVAGIYPGEAGQAPIDALTLDQVKAEIDAKYGVNFNKDAIKIEDGKVSIVGSVLSTADWYKVKAGGNTTIPYKISLLKENATDITNQNRALRIAMYADGKAVIENGAGQPILAN